MSTVSEGAASAFAAYALPPTYLLQIEESTY